MTLRSLKLSQSLAAVLALFAIARAERAEAFCGFYVTGADSNLYANATMVVMMRDGTRTVLSIQNNYQGPPEAFALVVPVPVVLQKENVKVLPKDVFQHVDALGAPRLVEYWEADPCRPQFAEGSVMAGSPTPAAASFAGGTGAIAPAVKIEAQFAVGEYDVVVLSANDSSALDTWLRANKYNIPSGAAPVLMPYVAAGMKFFVAKVDPARVTFNGDQAVLSPLRFNYDSQDFSLPVRLGLLNSQGSQDLIVNILATERYEVANYPNVKVATNIRVQNGVRNDFASFYEALFSREIEKNPRAVVTEYAWASGSCDPCPTPPLSQQDLLTLGGDVLQPAPQQSSNPQAPVASPPNLYSFTLTRLHARYSKDSLGEDLVFAKAPAITGGRGIPGLDGDLDQRVTEPPNSNYNNFQGRYVILHPWEGALTCQSPKRGEWGGPPGSFNPQPMTHPATNSALTGMAPKAGDLSALLAESVPSLSVIAQNPLSPLSGAASTVAPIGGSVAPAAGRSAAGAVAGQPALAGVQPTVPATPNGGSQTASTTAGSAPPKKSIFGCSVTLGAGNPPFALTALAATLATLVTRTRRRRFSSGTIG